MKRAKLAVTKNPVERGKKVFDPAKLARVTVVESGSLDEDLECLLIFDAQMLDAHT